MSENILISQDEVAALKHFHAQHFPAQSIPDIKPSALSHVDTTIQPDANNDHLGYYDDGVQRTLTDDQIAMFRNSEIQQLLAARRRAQEQKEDNDRKKERREKRDAQGQPRSSKRVFDDEADLSVQSLMYDEDPGSVTGTDGKSKMFMWPKLGR